MAYKNVPSKVDTRWKEGIPRIRNNVSNLRKIKRRNTDNNFCVPSSPSGFKIEEAHEVVEEIEEAIDEVEATPECDEVFDEMENNERSAKETFDNNNSTVLSNTSIESVNDHFSQLFQQLDDYMGKANELDCIFIHRRKRKMKETMSTITSLFEELLQTGGRLERFLAERQNNNNY